ncbi:hypothetical protein EP47_09190 [Legionella norrlandica]|uniref:Flagellar hook-basal body complex protein FliE n=1 Tax=Legionella norrlandica TaxID=1498499 RepID=A0A0A2SU97_9GAMM|nr:flagellar hook-basal body complex protein FliE [Legionella norrlandica]KGP63296.1 hypothetical protein EP47_09190 [Legionella norrlandica]
MKINAANLPFLTTLNKSSEVTQKSNASFADWISEKIINTNSQLNAAEHALAELAAGKAENLHQTMITLEQAKLSFQYLEQIRNRLMTAYQELLREQI